MPFQLKVQIPATCTAANAVLLILRQYQQSGLEPPLPRGSTFELRIADDDGEIDDDLPSLFTLIFFSPYYYYYSHYYFYLPLLEVDSFWQQHCELSSNIFKPLIHNMTIIFALQCRLNHRLRCSMWALTLSFLLKPKVCFTFFVHSLLCARTLIENGQLEFITHFLL
jgi:hypothetical protein